MKLPISNRLLRIAELVPQGARVADIGCDHGYLGIHLLLQNRVDEVYASDLNPQPLETAQRNANKYGVADKMHFCCANGLAGIDPESVDTIVCAGMGGEVMRKILESAPWVRQNKYILLLQPQSVPAEFRAWLFAEGFSILEEYPIFEKGHMYFTMKIRYTGEIIAPTPGMLFVTKPMLQSNSPDLPQYLENVLQNMNKSIDGLLTSGKPSQRLDFLLAARKEILEMRETYAPCQ